MVSSAIFGPSIVRLVKRRSGLIIGTKISRVVSLPTKELSAVTSNVPKDGELDFTISE